jgi:hypothetical protein
LLADGNVSSKLAGYGCLFGTSIVRHRMVRHREDYLTRSDMPIAVRSITEEGSADGERNDAVPQEA